MAKVDYKKYKVWINPDSKKVQGLQTGDIIRRQYFDGTNIIYTLMCVLAYGTERIRNNGVFEDRQYFVGAMLEGDDLIADNTDDNYKRQILDFARITNLFNVDRSGALYLTASDSEAPFMDVIDGIGRNKSLSWPENISSEAFEDSTSQYVVVGGALRRQYAVNDVQGNHRILTVTRQSAVADSFEGLKQDFYQFVKNPNQVLVSYKVRASQAMQAKMTLGYIDDLQKDAEWFEDISTEWEYKFHAITVDFSGRHLRSFKIDMSNLPVGEELQIADFNIILLSSVANFADASATRVGKMDGVVDPVFGRLTGYGAYLQKLYASQAAHISGTLTAGDENGFGSTFYAGKIHRNCLINSVGLNFNHGVSAPTEDLINPTGMGVVHKFTTDPLELRVQTPEWLANHVGQRYCFSCWIYAKKPCQFGVSQNGHIVGTIHVTADQTHEWRRVHAYFDLIAGETDGSYLLIGLMPSYQASIYQSVGSEERNPDENVFYFTAPQLEAGELVTQYQPTDSELNYTDEYGAWFARGGIGGTMQNPLLKLNYDGEGSIGTQNDSIVLRQDGSGHLAKQNIKWDERGKVTFGKDVTLNWENLGDSAQDEMANRYMRIVGHDTFAIIGQDADAPISPSSITLELEEVGFTSSSSQRQWYYKQGGEFIPIENGNGPTLTITPDSYMWGCETLQNGQVVGGESSLTVQCVITLNASRTYSDTFTVKKQYVQGYTVEVTSSKGTSFQNGTCATKLTAHVYYQGKLVDDQYAIEHFQFIWRCFRTSSMTERDDFEYEVDEATPNQIELNYELDASDTIVCELATAENFDYTFPITF